MSVTLISVSHDTVVSNKHEERTRHYYVNFQQFQTSFESRQSPRVSEQMISLLLVHLCLILVLWLAWVFQAWWPEVGFVRFGVQLQLHWWLWSLIAPLRLWFGWSQKIRPRVRDQRVRTFSSLVRVRYSPKWRERSFQKGSDSTGWFRVASAHSSQSGILIVIGRGGCVVWA